MRKLCSLILIIAFTMLLTIVSCKKKNNPVTSKSPTSLNTVEIAFDSTQIKTFFEKYPKLKNYQGDVEQLYRKHQFHYIWFDKDGLNEFAGLLYNKVNNLIQEGIETPIPYKEKLDAIYDNPDDSQKASIDTELLSSALYFFYADKVYHGISTQKTKDLEWFLPRKRQSYVNYLDSLLINPSLINKGEKGVLKQYYLLKEILQQYRKIEKKGGWKAITRSFIPPAPSLPWSLPISPNATAMAK